MQNPDLGNLQKCDPYSSFGVFCNADSYIEGFIIILGVIILVALTLWFVKKNQETNKDDERAKKWQ
ncbi:hypothetical protein [Hydrogenothermus marinus]|uniref:Uncharacterized protein n=1 Tax=Hydrogenothermus marinus TaxID=133270 RepID=A0A3M0BQJ5_9AQUI|nr:hypothetical protein [Hydrogenothermus marinus]RMA97098.1 hypothetical protein CLV39_0753 [Hydrogenothermus marinus]